MASGLGLHCRLGNIVFVLNIRTAFLTSLDLNLDKPIFPSVCLSKTAGPSCSKYQYLNKLVSGQNVNCSSKYNILFTGIFAEKM